MNTIKPWIVYQNLIKMNNRISSLERKVQKIEKRTKPRPCCSAGIVLYTYMMFMFAFIYYLRVTL